MFVERLSREQVKEFLLKKELEGDLFYPEYGIQIELKKFREEEWCWWIEYATMSRPFYLLNDRVTPLFGMNLEETWIQYLYSIFGEEYKEWFMAEKAKLFD